MNRRSDSAIYSEALSELRKRHHDEFEQIRHGLLAEAGLSVDPSANGSSAARNRVAALGYITSYVESHGRRPTFRDVAHAVGVSDYTARLYVIQLERSGDLAPVERVCPYCEKSLKGKRASARFCSGLCKSRFYNGVPRDDG